ncbi:hypothetical protein VNO77_44111 [Canavalia gladiata]|uniref:Uncharacterized protein n=1 Tax=Canavalia gladiata TaxID=3824 RepID=A0AAN9PNH8_CANGL
MKWEIIPKAALASERPSHQARPRRSSSSPFLSVLWTSGLALGAAEMHGSTYLWSRSSLFPASGSFNACHDLLERLHEQNRGANSCLQRLITSELRSSHQPPTMLLDLPPLAQSGHCGYASDSWRGAGFA